MTQAASVESASDDTPSSPWARARRVVPPPRVSLATLSLIGVLLVIASTMGSSLVGARTLVETGVLRVEEPWLSEQPQDWIFEGSWLGDQVNVVLPSIDEFTHRLRDGEIGWWSPYNDGGAPLGAVGESSAFSPLMTPYAVLPLWLAPAWSHLSVMLVSIGGTVLFLRRLGASRAAGLVAGLAFATSGFMYLWLHWPHVRVAAFIPLLFWAVERAVQERRASSVVPLALVVTVMLLGFFPAVAGYALGAAGLYAVVRLWALRRSGVAHREIRATGLRGVLAVALGFGLVAWLILPFNEFLGGLDLDYREQSTSCHAPAGALGSLIFPRYGSSERFDFACPTGEHETDAFAGAMVLGLAVVGALAPGGRRRGPRNYFVGLGAVTVVLVYLGGPGLWLVQQIPALGDNRVTRMRVLLSFALAVLAGFGVDRLRAAARESERRPAIIAAAGLLGLATIAMWTIRDWRDIPMPPLDGWIPVVACVIAAGALVASGSATRPALRRAGMALVPLLVAAEAVAAIVPYWPADDPDDLYAATSTTDFLVDNLGSDRLLSTNYTLLPNANRVYGLRSVTGRSFHEDAWGDLMTIANGRSTGLRTLTRVDQLPVELVEAPVLDRLAARYYVTSSAYPIYGEGRDIGPATGRAELRPDEPVTVPLDGPVRAVGFELPEAPEVGGDRPRVVVDLLDARGDVLATGSQRLFQWVAAGPWQVAVPGDTAPGAVAARLTLVDAAAPLVVTGHAGGPLSYVVEPGDDDLRLVHAEGTAIYERPSALPRIRWASEAVVEPDADRRLDLLADPTLPADVVVLSDRGPSGSEAGAEVEVTEDSGERISATVRADGQGYLVVADSIQRGWRAEVDGEPAELREADHALVAVALPAGTHQVDVVYDPPGRRVGGWIAVGSAVGLVVLALSGAGRRPRAGWTTRVRRSAPGNDG